MNGILFRYAFIACLGFIPVWRANACPCSDQIKKIKDSVSQGIAFELDHAPRTLETLYQQMRLFRADEKNADIQFQIGVTYLTIADPQHWEYVDQAITFFEEVHKIFPNDPLVMMYLGQATGARALNVEPSVFKRLRWVKDAYKYMDEAVRLEPDCFFLRLLRGESQILAHPVLRRGARLDEDAHFLSKFADSEQYRSLPPYQKARLQLFLGNYLEKRQKPKEQIHGHWQETIALASGTPYAKEAQERLQGAFKTIGYNEEEDEG